MKNSELLPKLDPDVTQKFDQKNILYWNYSPDESKKTYMSWQSILNTEDRKVSQCDKHSAVNRLHVQIQLIEMHDILHSFLRFGCS